MGPPRGRTIIQGLFCANCRKESVRLNGLKKGKQSYRCVECGSYAQPVKGDVEIIAENVRLSKQKQRFQDSNRIERKAFREYARLDNALLEQNKALVELLEHNSFTKHTKTHNVKGAKAVGISHISDIHSNELVDLEFNKYNFTVLSQRLKLLAEETKREFRAYGIKNILLASTGDHINSDRRLDEKLNMAMNRMQSAFLTIDLLKSFILDLNQEFNVSIAAVSGNESRINEEYGFSDIILSDNYDYMIYNCLKMLFLGAKSVKFMDLKTSEDFISVGGKNILLIHGDQYKSGDVERKVIQTCGKYSARGVKIDFVLFGHLHYARIGDHFARSSSMVGANDYSDVGLQLISKASQNIHIVTNTGQLHSKKVDLQDVDHVKGYKFDKALEAYNPKSKSKLKDRKVTFEVII